MTMDWLEGSQPHMVWLALGLLLAVAEILVPGVFLIWLAGAAILTGVLAYVLPIDVPIQVVIFAAAAIIAVFAGRSYIARHPVTEADPKMNRRGQRLVGEMGPVTQAIIDGKGRMRLGDTEWLVRGPDAPVGATVRVTGSDGAELLVEVV
jgi:membrane protein implicated in regulation of membrane protease activity